MVPKSAKVNIIKNPAESLPVLEVLQLSVNLLNIEVGPQYVVVTGDAVNDRIIQTVELRQQGQLSLDPLQLWILCR